MSQLLTPSEVLDVIPEAKEFFNAQKIGWLVSLGLVEGYRARRVYLVDVDDFKHFLQFYRQKQSRPWSSFLAPA